MYIPTRDIIFSIASTILSLVKLVLKIEWQCKEENKFLFFFFHIMKKDIVRGKNWIYS